MITDTDRAYLAGIIDGEGTLMIHGNRRTSETRIYFDPVVAVTNTDTLLVERCREIAGGYILGPITVPGKFSKICYRWVAKNRQAEHVVRLVLPYLISKREQASVILALRSMTQLGASPGDRGRGFETAEEIADKLTCKLAIQALNHRGTSPIPDEMAQALLYFRSHLMPTPETEPLELVGAQKS